MGGFLFYFFGCFFVFGSDAVYNFHWLVLPSVYITLAFLQFLNVTSKVLLPSFYETAKTIVEQRETT